MALRRSGRIRVDTPEYPAAEVPVATTRRSRRASGTPRATSGRVTRRSRGTLRSETTRTTDRKNNIVSSIDQPSENVSTSRSNRRPGRTSHTTRNAPRGNSPGNPGRGHGARPRRSRNEEPIEVSASNARHVG